MDELERQMDAIREGVAPEWDTDRSARVYAGVGQLQRRLAVRRAATIAASGGFVAALAVFSWTGQDAPAESPVAAKAPVVAAPAVQPVAPVEVAAQAPAESGWRFVDGSRAERAADGGEITVRRDEARHVAVELVRGAVMFDVVPRSDRVFEVTAGDWNVRVLGTRFELGLDDEGLRVAVERGRVRVEGPGGVREVGAGESVQLGAPMAAPATAPRERVRPVAEPPKPSWRSLIQSGDYDAAYQALQAGARVDDDPWSLMDAADAARLSGRPAGAVDYLDQVIGKHGASAVAPLAAFTLGRLQLDRLGEPRAAARTFAKALALAPNGSLAQDALAREVEAWAKAGVAEKAYTRATEYVASYPDGRRIKAVRRYGGLDD